MKVMVFGANGQVGSALRDLAPSGISCEYLDSDSCDISDSAAVSRSVDAFEPRLIINAAAYTAVDKAESEAETAHAVNAEGPKHLALAAAAQGARLIQISTDFVFDGTASSPIKPDQSPNPLSVYGQTKLQGEVAALDTNPDATAIIRTSWVYSRTGSNFVKTMLRLMAEKDELSVVADQAGSPTWATSLAEAIWNFAATPETNGLFHWSDAGETTWYGFAMEIQQQGLAAGLLPKEIPIHPISTEQYPTPAKRPRYSVLDCTTAIDAVGYSPAHWRDNLAKMISELSN